MNRRPDVARARLDALEEKNSWRCRILKDCFWLSSPYASHYENYVFPMVLNICHFCVVSVENLKYALRNYRMDWKKVSKMQRQNVIKWESADYG